MKLLDVTSKHEVFAEPTAQASRQREWDQCEARRRELGEASSFFARSPLAVRPAGKVKVQREESARLSNPSPPSLIGSSRSHMPAVTHVAPTHTRVPRHRFDSPSLRPRGKQCSIVAYTHTHTDASLASQSLLSRR